MGKLVSKVYGDALLMAALDGDCLDELYAEAQTLTKVFRENEELLRFLNHPRIVKEEKLRVVEQVFSGRVSDEMTGLLTTVVEKDRQNDIFEIFRYFTDQVKERKRIGTAYVTTAAELSGTQKEQVKERLLETTSYREFEMIYDTDPSLIGGMVIRIGDRVVDSSIRTRLQNLKRQLMDVQLAR